LPAVVRSSRLQAARPAPVSTALNKSAEKAMLELLASSLIADKGRA
jgi:hypothetical protein